MFLKFVTSRLKLDEFCFVCVCVCVFHLTINRLLIEKELEHQTEGWKLQVRQKAIG